MNSYSACIGATSVVPVSESAKFKRNVILSHMHMVIIAIKTEVNLGIWKEAFGVLPDGDEQVLSP